jgi:hypothetical protein
MGAQIIDFNDNIITVRISGVLQQQELAAAQKMASEMIRKQGDMQKQGRVSVLVIVENFKGWAKTGDWEDMSFMIENDQHIKKMAVVVDKKWEDLMDMFVGKGLREFPIENFQPSEKEKAIDWLGRV